jgi:LemA protein
VSTSQIVLAVMAAVLVFWAIGGYNRMVALRNTIAAAWARVEEPLGRRRALMMQLVDVVRPELPDKLPALDAVAAAASQAAAAVDAVRARPSSARAMASFSMAQAVFDAAAAQLLATIEGGDTLRARPDVASALDGWREAETGIAFARQGFNEAVANYNESARLFPTRILSWLFGFKAAGTW